MHMRRYLEVLFALGLLLASGSHAQSDEARELAAQLVVRSGLADQLKSYPKQMDADIARTRGQVPDELVAALREAAQASFDAAALRQDIERTLAAEMPAQDMRAAIAWLETPVGRRVTLAEVDATASMSPERLEAYAAARAKQPPAKARGELLAGLVEATKAVEHMVRVTESIALGVAAGVDAAQPVQNRMGLATLRARLKAAMPPEKLRAAVSEAMPLFYGYTYQRVSDADLATYLEFNRSPLGVRYNDALMKAFTIALTRASVGMGPIIEQGMKKKAA